MLEIYLLDNHAGKAIGLDVSEYQGKSVGLMWIPWNKYPVHFVFIRHRGNDRLTNNLMKIGVAPKAATLSGSYHYYPNENSLEQATFIKTVLKKGFASGFRY
jgi:lysozyme